MDCLVEDFVEISFTKSPYFCYLIVGRILAANYFVDAYVEESQIITPNSLFTGERFEG